MNLDKMGYNDKTIAVIVAMQKELDLLLHLIDNTKTVETKDAVYHEGSINGHKVIATKCGIGKVNAAIGTKSLIDRYNPSLVINSGVAGGAGNAAGILDVVVAETVAYHDVWCGPGTDHGVAAGCPDRFTCDPRITSLECLKVTGNLKHGMIASGDIFISRPEEVGHIRTLYPDVMAVDMESAAIAQVCYLCKVPFVCIRVISDTPGAADNISQYDTFWDDAPRHTFEILKTVLGHIPAEL